MSPRPDLSVLIVTYNSAHHIEACLDSLGRARDGLTVEVLVADNASSDGTVGLLRGRGDVQLVESGRNLGFAAACNLLARRSTGQHLLFLNPDAVVEPQTLSTLLRAAEEHPEAGILGTRACSPTGRVLASCAQGELTYWSLLCFASGLSSLFSGSRLFDPEGLGGWDRETDREVPVVSGGGMLVSRAAWNLLGGFDEDYFMYGEDADLCARAWQAGLRPRFITAARIVHDVGASSRPGQKQVLLHRGKATLLRKRSRLSGSAGVTLLVVGVAVRAVVARTGALPSSAARVGGAAWREAWHRRAEWVGGWPAEGAGEVPVLPAGG